jgi:ribosome-associated toxin RatA of RatAB toxin-antitoxin module
MRKVVIRARTEESIEEIWDVIIDIKNWDKLIKFVKRIEINEKVEKGTVFHDITGIFWIPLKVKHKIVKIDKYKNFQMEAYMPFGGGIMHQEILIENKGKFSEITIEVSFKINSSLLDLMFGHILKIRLKEMIKDTLLKLQENLNNKNIKRGIIKKSEIIN